MKIHLDNQQSQNLFKLPFRLGTFLPSVIYITAIIIQFMTCPASAEPTDTVREYQIKASFLYKFLLFVEWPEKVPEHTEDTIVIGILGKDPFGDTFVPVEGQTIKGKTLRIKRFKDDTSHELLKKCHLLFISSSFEENMNNVLESLKDHPVLTVCESSAFLPSGGMIHIFSKQNRVVFEINKAVAERAGIKFRSKLLRIAVRVVGD